MEADCQEAGRLEDGVLSVISSSTFVPLCHVLQCTLLVFSIFLVRIRIVVIGAFTSTFPCFLNDCRTQLRPAVECCEPDRL